MNYELHQVYKVVKLNFDKELERVVSEAPGVQSCEFYGKISEYSTENQDGVLFKRFKILRFVQSPISLPIILGLATGLPAIGISFAFLWFNFIKKPKTK